MSRLVINKAAVDSLYNNEVMDNLLKIGEDVQDVAKTLVAVKTGALRDSIDVKQEGNSIEVGSDKPYAMKEELRHPYLRPAIAIVKSKRGIK